MTPILGNRTRLDSKGNSHIRQVNIRFEQLQEITTELDTAGLTLSDVELAHALTQGEITLKVEELARLLRGTE